MPVVIVTAARLTDESAELAAAASLAGCIADALDLRAEDVYVTLSAANIAVIGVEPVRPWPVIVIYGRWRATGPEALVAARSRAAKLWNTSMSHVWAQWVQMEPAE